ncbi:MAG: DotU/TssL family secretion system protein [Candidatus Binataceae bacterium]
MAPSLREVFTPLISYMLLFERTPVEQQRPFTDVRATIERLLDQQRQAVKRNDLPQADYDNACFAVIAWIDESVLRHVHDSNPALYDEWRRSPLQVKLFNTANAGEEFFERLNRLGPAQKEVRELYFLALAMGFRGRYYDDAQVAQLIELRRQAAALLPIPVADLLDLEKRQERITPQPYEIQPPPPAVRRRRPSPYWLALPVAIAAGIIIFLLWPSGPNRALVEQALQGRECDHVKLLGIDHGVVKIAGHVDSAHEATVVRNMVEAVPGVKSVNADLTTIPRPFCEVMETLGPFHRKSDANGFDLTIRPSKGCDATYYRGENMEVDITAKKPLHYVYVDYYVADRQNVAHLFPNPDRADNLIGASTELTVGGMNSKAQWQIQPPFGREMVTVISSPKPLFSPPRLDPEPAQDYLSSLRQALDADAPDADVAASYCFTISAENPGH